MICQAKANLRAHHPLFDKALRIWLGKDVAHQKVWTNFKACMYTLYKRILLTRGGGTLEADGYRCAFNAIASEDTAILMKTVVGCAEQSARTLAEIGELQARLEAMAIQQQLRVENFVNNAVSQATMY